MSTYVDTFRVSRADARTRPSISFWRMVIVRMRNWQSRMRARRQIAELSDRQLRDIGMTRRQSEQHAVQPFRPLIQ